MKNILAIVIAVLAMTMCVASATDDTSKVNADVLSAIEITAPVFSGTWALDPTPAVQPNQKGNDASYPLFVKSNCKFKVDVKSDSTDGRMRRWREVTEAGGSAYATSPVPLTNPLEIKGGTIGVSLTSSDAPFITNGLKTGPTPASYPISLEQEIDQWLDGPIDNTGSENYPMVYHIEIIFAASQRI